MNLLLFPVRRRCRVILSQPAVRVSADVWMLSWLSSLAVFQSSLPHCDQQILISCRERNTTTIGIARGELHLRHITVKPTLVNSLILGK